MLTHSEAEVPRLETIGKALSTILENSCQSAYAAVAQYSGFQFDEEMVHLKAANNVRRSEFIAGRTAARAALSKIKIGPSAIPAGGGNAPRWPEGVVGSISHCAEFAIAAIGDSKLVKSIGIDVAKRDSVPIELWGDLFTPEECDHLLNVESHPRSTWPVIFFSIKESFFKYQYPITKSWIDFKEISLSCADRQIIVETTRLSTDLQEMMLGLARAGRYSVVGPYVLTAFSSRVAQRLEES